LLEQINNSKFEKSNISNELFIKQEELNKVNFEITAKQKEIEKLTSEITNYKEEFLALGNKKESN